MNEKRPQTNSSTAIPRSATTAAEFVEKLKRALKREGDFPANARVVGELRTLVADPKTTASQVTEMILKEPTLGTRVLHMVNSSYYRRAKPIMTVSQAVIQIGMRPLAEMCAGLVLLQKFVPNARRGGAFASCLQRTILTSLLSSSITSSMNVNSRSKTDETGYLAGSFAELGILLLAYYFPQVYETAVKRAEAKNQDIRRSIQEILGISTIQLSLEVMNALGLPPFYTEALQALQDQIDGKAPPASGKDQSNSQRLGSALYAAQEISSVIVHSEDKQALNDVVGKLQSRFNLPAEILTETVSKLPTLYRDHCSSLDLPQGSLPEYVTAYSNDASLSAAAPTPASEGTEINFTSYVDEIREAVESKEPTASIITRVMETMAFSLGFDRVLLLLINPGKKKLCGRMMLGVVGDFDPKSLERPYGISADQYAPDAMAFTEGRCVFAGEPIFEDGWPLACIPIGFGRHAIGVVYADRVNSTSEEIPAREQAAIGVLAELLDQTITGQSQ